MTLSRYQVGTDGRTGYEWLRDRRCDMAIGEFGEAVMYKELRPAETERNKAEIGWKTGVYLGSMVRSNESVIGTVQGVIKAFAVKRRPMRDRWNHQAVTEMPGALIRPNPTGPGHEHITISIEGRAEREEAKKDEAEDAESKDNHTRRTIITRGIFETVGYTEHCEGCRYMQARMEEQTPHTGACRGGIEEEMVKRHAKGR